MLSDSYTSGYYAAYDAVGLECSLEKEAGVKDFMKKILLAGVVAGGGAKGAAVGGRFGEAKMTQYATENLNAIMSQKKARGAFVDAAKFVEENMSESRYVRTSPEEMARATIKAMDAAGTLPKKFSTDKMVRDWMTQAPYADIKSGSNAAFNPALGAVTGERTHPSLLAHELLGHGEQAYGKDLRRWYDDVYEANSSMGKLKGHKHDYEQDAWNRARKAGFKIDPEVEDASMNYYRSERAGLAGGGVAGAGAGAGATGLGLMGIASLLEKMKRKKR